MQIIIFNLLERNITIIPGLAPTSPTSLYSNQDPEGQPDPPPYSQVFTVEFTRTEQTVAVDVTDLSHEAYEVMTL